MSIIRSVCYKLSIQNHVLKMPTDQWIFGLTLYSVLTKHDSLNFLFYHIPLASTLFINTMTMSTSLISSSQPVICLANYRTIRLVSFQQFFRTYCYRRLVSNEYHTSTVQLQLEFTPYVHSRSVVRTHKSKRWGLCYKHHQLLLQAT